MKHVTVLSALGLFFAPLLTLAALAPNSFPSRFTSALRHALGANASWKMERILPGSTRPLLSTGTVECAVGKGIRWEALYPVPSLIEMTLDGMVFENEDERSVREADKLPHYTELCKAIDAFVAGDDDVFDGLVEIKTATVFDNGCWEASLEPKIREMRRIVTEIILSGATTPTGVVMRTSNGGLTTIRFTEATHAQ